MSNLMDAVTTVADGAIGWMGEYADAIASNTILLLGVVAVPLVGLGVGLLGRLLKRRV